MKKSILTLAAFCTAIISATCICACDLFDLPGATETKDYEPLNEMLRLDYSQVKLTVTDTFENGLSLESEYVIDYSDEGITVKYTVERFSSISLDLPTENAKTTVTGEAKDGDVINVGGETVTVNADMAGRGLTFKQEYFSNADLAAMWLKADVTNVVGFMGTAINCTNMKVEAYFLEIFYSVKITYATQNGDFVEILYEFNL